MKPWFLYLLECGDGSIYTGITTDVEGKRRSRAVLNLDFEVV